MTQALTFPVISAVGNIDAYIQSAKQFPILTQEEEFRLATRFREEDDLEAALSTGSLAPASGHFGCPGLPWLWGCRMPT